MYRRALNPRGQGYANSSAAQNNSVRRRTISYRQFGEKLEVAADWRPAFRAFKPPDAINAINSADRSQGSSRNSR
jgi:hypothetical protein